MPRRAALESLVEAERGRFGDLDARLTQSRLAPRDRDLARELVQGTLRNRGAVDLLLDATVKRKPGKVDPLVRAALRLGAYQIAFLDRIPARAAVHATVEAAKSLGGGPAAGFVNANLRAVTRLVGEPVAQDPGPRSSLPLADGRFVPLTRPLLPDPATDMAGHLAARWSHPEWLVERFLEHHGPVATLDILASGIARPLLSLRPLTGREGTLAAALRERGIEVAQEGRCLLVEGAGKVDDLPGFAEGWFTVQGPTAADVVPALSPEPGSAALDLCAAPGGKTLALAEAVGPEGLVLAVDRSARSLGRLRAEIERRGLSHVAVLEADATDPESFPSGVKGRPPGFDVVLVDVPCSNTGVLGRRVEARWRLEDADRITMLAEQGAHLLLVAAGKLRPGGRLAFSTCSIDREENQDVIRAFLAEDPSYRLLAERLTLPSGGRRDGGYFAILEQAARVA